MLTANLYIWLLIKTVKMHPVIFYGVYSVVACILVCETGGTGSIPVRHPKLKGEYYDLGTNV